MAHPLAKFQGGRCAGQACAAIWCETVNARGYVPLTWAFAKNRKFGAKGIGVGSKHGVSCVRAPVMVIARVKIKGAGKFLFCDHGMLLKSMYCVVRHAALH